MANSCCNTDTSHTQCKAYRCKCWAHTKANTPDSRRHNIGTDLRTAERNTGTTDKQVPSNSTGRCCIRCRSDIKALRTERNTAAYTAVPDEIYGPVPFAPCG